MAMAKVSRPPPPGGMAVQNRVAIETLLRFAPASKRAETASWLRSGSPLQRRMHRNTRATLRQYFALGLLLEALRGLGRRDTKRDRFYEQLHKLRSEARAVLIFTEYTDTLEYLRDSLVDHFPGDPRRLARREPRAANQVRRALAGIG